MLILRKFFLRILQSQANPLANKAYNILRLGKLYMRNIKQVSVPIIKLNLLRVGWLSFSIFCKSNMFLHSLKKKTEIA
jgi:hypothetical protein